MFLHMSSCVHGRQDIWVIYTWARTDGLCAHLALCFLSNSFLFSRPITECKCSSSLACIAPQLLSLCQSHRCKKIHHCFSLHFCVQWSENLFMWSMKLQASSVNWVLYLFPIYSDFYCDFCSLLHIGVRILRYYPIY